MSEQATLGVGGLGWEAHASVLSMEEPKEAQWLEPDRIRHQTAQARVSQGDTGTDLQLYTSMSLQGLELEGCQGGCCGCVV